MTAWKDVKGYEGIYQVSEYGFVRSLDRTIWNKGVGSYQRLKGKNIKPKINTTGYREVMLYNHEGKTKMHRLNRLVAIAFIPNPEEKPFVNHVDGIKTNDSVENLEWATCKENNNHAIRIGLTKFGDGNKSSKLTEKIVRSARKDFLSGDFTCYQLARKYKISDSTMIRAIKGESWFYVTDIVVTKEDWERINKKKKLKLTEELFLTIKSRSEKGEPVTGILKEYGIGRTTYYRFAREGRYGIHRNNKIRNSCKV